MSDDHDHPSSHIALAQYAISLRNGFLPSSLPLSRLSDSYYDPWESIIARLSVLVSNGEIRKEIDNLSVLSTSQLYEELDWRRAYVVLAFLAHGYIWGGGMPSDVCIRAPFPCFLGTKRSNPKS
jgi:indoleamine 2,3-dioxygenase